MVWIYTGRIVTFMAYNQVININIRKSLAIGNSVNKEMPIGGIDNPIAMTISSPKPDPAISKVRLNDPFSKIISGFVENVFSNEFRGIHGLIIQ